MKFSINSKLRSIGFIILTIALTFLSVKAQFHFWRTLFDYETAITASIVFELLRLITLFNGLRGQGNKKIIGMMTYLGIAIFCGTIAIISWNSEIIHSNQIQNHAKNTKLQAKIHEIKTVYAKEINNKISQFDRDLNYIDSKIAAAEKSTYWLNRKLQIENKKQEILTEMDLFLSAQPDKPLLWIDEQCSRLNLSMDLELNDTTDHSALEKAILEITNMSLENTQKLVAIIFTLFIELGIILLALMTESDIAITKVTKYDDVVRLLESTFQIDDINDFFNKNHDAIMTKGDILKSSQMTQKLRPIRKIIVSSRLNKEQLSSLCNHYSGG